MSAMLKRPSPARVLSEVDTENLGSLMTYVYAWNWLQQNVHIDYQSEVLATFAKGPQTFLMEMILLAVI